MTKDELLKLAKPYEWHGNLPAHLTGWTFNSEDELLAFANAIEQKAMDEQKSERAVICKNCGALYWEEVSQCDCQVGIETQWEVAKVVRANKE